MGLDIGDFYLEAPMDEYEYMKIPLNLFPQHTIDQYKPQENAQNGQVYLEVWQAIYGLSQAGALANKQLEKFLAPGGYYEVAHTPGLWRHATRPIQFSLVVDNCGVKYVGKEHVEHLVHCLKKHYAKVSEDWEGKLCCRITVDWNYIERWVDISMPGYIKRLRQRYGNIAPKKPQHSPYRAQPKIYGAAAQDSMPTHDSPLIDGERKDLVQQIIGGVLYYGRVVNLMVFPALSSIASEQASATETPRKNARNYWII